MNGQRDNFNLLLELSTIQVPQDRLPSGFAPSEDPLAIFRRERALKDPGEPAEMLHVEAGQHVHPFHIDHPGLLSKHWMIVGIGQACLSGGSSEHLFEY